MSMGAGSEATPASAVGTTAAKPEDDGVPTALSPRLLAARPGTDRAAALRGTRIATKPATRKIRGNRGATTRHLSVHGRTFACFPSDLEIRLKVARNLSSRPATMADI